MGAATAGLLYADGLLLFLKGGRAVPKGTKVDKVYEALRRQGKSKGSAARIAQAATGKSLKTGRAPKKK